ncbi:MAG TPA: thioredoxin family protein [Trichocoleus sp.]|jgi:thiol:disulfide interchange protein
MTANSSNPTPQSNLLSRIRNLIIVLVAIILSTSIFLGLRFGSDTGTLAAMAETATPIETALTNGKPTLMEFYADWCTSCQAMAKDMSDLRQTFGDRVNFVMLNVDNTKWLPEMLYYRVDGIPHFVFLDPQGESIASTIGEQPRPVMAANLEALASGDSLPYLQTKGRISEVESPTAPSKSADPRSHGSQVVTQ